MPVIFVGYLSMSMSRIGRGVMHNCICIDSKYGFLTSISISIPLVVMVDDTVVETFTLLGIAVVFVVLRIVYRVKTVGVYGFQLDDYAMVVATVGPRVCSTVAHTTY